ncbi:hypothetical protein HDK90DRAFT_102494 [Phyllosticta capitalensis]|uniref:Uncharacterized protein n=1 Tax=Phyllosticta capitalensis TaxID=121624 RepID=A0ABR1YAP7_9PEZI
MVMLPRYQLHDHDGSRTVITNRKDNYSSHSLAHSHGTKTKSKSVRTGQQQSHHSNGHPSTIPIHPSTRTQHRAAGTVPLTHSLLSQTPTSRVRPPTSQTKTNQSNHPTHISSHNFKRRDETLAEPTDQSDACSGCWHWGTVPGWAGLDGTWADRSGIFCGEGVQGEWVGRREGSGTSRSTPSTYAFFAWVEGTAWRGEEGRWFGMCRGHACVEGRDRWVGARTYCTYAQDGCCVGAA